jgi:hypothetical protein
VAVMVGGDQPQIAIFQALFCSPQTRAHTHKRKTLPLMHLIISNSNTFWQTLNRQKVIFTVLNVSFRLAKYIQHYIVAPQHTSTTCK